MLKRVTIKNFKRFAEQSFDLEDAMILAGPNNSGKSTLLQAIVTWKFGLDRWLARRKGAGRYGVAITRPDFTAVPLREMNLLWEDRKVRTTSEKQRSDRLIEIIITGESRGQDWECGIEFGYSGPEQIYVRPLNLKSLAKEARDAFPPEAAKDVSIVHVPPLSGILRDEPKHDRGMQDLLIGQGRPGDILRNLLLEIANKQTKKNWNKLAEHTRSLFRIDLKKPSYSYGQPYIVCEYLDPDYSRPLDLSNVGSGTLQVLLLLAFLYARPATTILLDEPDAHQHIILQKQVYELVREVARDSNGQVIVATHSEVILDVTEPAKVIGFFGKPHPLADRTERDRIREALKCVTTTDLLLGREVGAVLYVESGTDERILSQWASILDHSSQCFFKRPFVHYLLGRNLREARTHFFAMYAAFPQMRGICLLDGDNRDEPDEEIERSGLVVLRWKRHEIENYLLQPEAMKRIVPPLWKQHMDQQIEKEFWQLVPRGTDLFGDHPSLLHVKASNKFLVPLFEKIKPSLPKKDLYLIAAKMQPEEIHPEVKEKLDKMAEVLCP